MSKTDNPASFASPVITPGAMRFLHWLGQRFPLLDTWLAQFRRNAHWEAKLETLSRPRALLVWLLRLGHLLYRGAGESELRGQAAALTFSTLMSLIPLLALSLSLVKGLGLHHQFIESLQDYLVQLPPDLQNFFRRTIDTVETTDFGQLGGLGAAILLFTAIQVLGRVEIAFNGVWGIAEMRPLMRRLTTQISVIFIVPILLLAAMSWFTKDHFRPDSPFPAGLLLQFLGSWLAFTFLYQMMPNTQVFWMPAIWAGLIGALLWQFWFQFYLMIQPGVTNYNIIYGTLASIPIFMAWLYTSWLIVLIGAKLTYAIQNESAFALHILSSKSNFKDRFIVAIAVLIEAKKALQGQAPLLEVHAFSRSTMIPPQLLQGMIDQLVEAKLLAQLDGSRTYALLRDPGSIQLQEIFEIITTQSGCAHSFVRSEALDPAFALFEELQGTLKGKWESRTLLAVKGFENT